MNKASWASFLLLCACMATRISAEPVVIGETSTIQSEILGEERALMVHVPGGYAASQASYPVVYLLDAGSLIGHSLGGLFALHALVTRPDTFDAYIAISPR